MVVNAQDCYNGVSEFELQSRSCIAFRTSARMKSVNFILSSTDMS